jgi:hypothetical protein
MASPPKQIQLRSEKTKIASGGSLDIFGTGPYPWLSLLVLTIDPSWERISLRQVAKHHPAAARPRRRWLRDPSRSRL